MHIQRSMLRPKGAELNTIMLEPCVMNLLATIHRAVPFPPRRLSKRSMAPALWTCYWEVLGAKVASSNSNSHPRLLIRIAGFDHRGRQR